MKHGALFSSLIALLITLGVFGVSAAQFTQPFPQQIPDQFPLNPTPQSTLDMAQWKHRLVITCSKPASGDTASFGIDYVQGVDRAGFVDRDIMLLHVLAKPRSGVLGITEVPEPKIWIIDSLQEVQSIKDKAACKPNSNSVALVGKDGGLKKVWRKTPPSNEDVFAFIDAMPMRRNEMRKPNAPRLDAD